MLSPIPDLKTVYSPEVLDELDIALQEVGDIVPVFDTEYQVWLFSSPLYPAVESIGETVEECIARYKGWLAEFITFRLQNRISESDEAQTKGRGGYRPGSGRPKGTTKAPTKQVRLPIDIAEWLKEDQSHLSQVRKIMNGNKKTATA